MYSIEFNKVIKNYGKVKALKDVSFKIEKGTIMGVFGPNGAGKTTIIKLILGVLASDGGEIKREFDRFSYLPEDLSLYKHEKVSSILNYMLSLKGIKKVDGVTQVNYWSKQLDINFLLERKVKDLSKGQKKKVMFLITMLGDADFIILDEPFTGLDVESAEGLKKIILAKHNEGKTILFSTHIPEYAEHLCSHLFIINEGKILLHGIIEDLKQENMDINWKVLYSREIEMENLDYLNKKGVTLIRDGELSFPQKYNLSDIVELSKNKINVIEIKKAQPSIREIYLDAVRSSK